MRWNSAALTDLHIEQFRNVSKQHPPRHVVGLTSWFVTVEDGKLILVTPYNVKQADGTWTEAEARQVL